MFFFIFNGPRLRQRTCLFVCDFDGVSLERDEGRSSALIKRRHLDEEFHSGLEVAYAQVRIPPRFVVQQNGRLRVEDLELELLRVAAVESGPAPNFHRIGRLVEDGAIAGRIRAEFFREAICY